MGTLPGFALGILVQNKGHWIFKPCMHDYGFLESLRDFFLVLEYISTDILRSYKRQCVYKLVEGQIKSHTLHSILPEPEKL